MFLSLALFVVAYVLIEGGVPFVGFLAGMVGILLLLVGGRKTGSSAVNIHEPMGPNGPIVVEQKLPPIPAKMYLKVKPDWTDRATFEYAMEHTGWWVDKLFRWIFYVLAGPKKAKEKGH